MKSSLLSRASLSALLSIAIGGVPSNGRAQGVERATASQPASTERDRTARVPLEVSRALERAELCQHLAGEINGDRAPQDQEVNAEMKKHKCGTAAGDLRRIKLKYARDDAVLKRIGQYEAEVGGANQ